MKLKTVVLASLTLVCSAAFAQSKYPKVDIQHALSAAEKAGYTHIRKIELENGSWEIKGLDDKGKKCKFNVNGTTGALTKD